MLELLQAYSLSEIIIFVIMLAVAVKALVSFWDWAMERLRKVFNKETQQEKQMDEIREHLNKHDRLLEKLSQNQDEIHQTMQDISDELALLISSDKDDIKSYITEKHHEFCYTKDWIDDYSLDCIEKRYDHYLAEGGNSYIAALMDEIRALPKVPPQDSNNEIKGV